MKKLLFFISIALLFSCKEKNKPQVLEGYIREYYSGKPLPNVRVLLYENVTEWLGTPSFTYITEINTDANGYYKFYQENGQDKSYIVELFEPVKCHKIEDFYSLHSQQSSAKVRKININLYKITPVKVHLTNPTGKLRSINISSYKSGIGGGCTSVPLDTVILEKCYYGVSDMVNVIVYDGLFAPVLYNQRLDVSFTNPDTNYLEININQ